MKSPIDKFIKELKKMHPIYAVYMMQRIQADLEVVREGIPELYKREKEMENSGVVSLFHPSFYVTYGNVMSDVLNEALDLSIEKFVEPSVFEDTKNEQQ